MRLLLGDAAAADYAAWRPCCSAAAELPALCAAETCSWFAAARGVATGVCATRAVLLCGNRQPCGHCSASALCQTGMVAQGGHCCADTICASYLFFHFELCHSGPDMHVHVISSDFKWDIMLFDLAVSVALYALPLHTRRPEVLYGLVLVFARMLRLHAESDWTCRSYTFMLLENIIFSGIFSDLGWTTSWRCPAWFLLCLLSYHFPLFPPKKKSDAEKAELARAELDEFIALHGKVPSQHSDLPGSKALYKKLHKVKLLHLLKHDWRRGVCDDTLKFYDLHGRIPRRQNTTTEEQRAEDALAQRWDRLLEQKASLPNELLHEYPRIFAATNVEVDDVHMAVCAAVSEFFDTTRRLPKRQVGDSDEKRAEDALARRWDRLMAEKASVSEELLSSYSAIFGAAEMEVDDGHLAVCVAVSEFFDTTRRLPKRQVGHSDERRAEDALARRWDRLMAEKASVSEELLSSYSAIFGAAEMEVDDAPRAVCIAVNVFFLEAQRLPRRVHVVTDSNREEDILARRWHRVVHSQSSVGLDLMGQFADIFTANSEAWNDAVESGLATFLDEVSVVELFHRCVALQEDAVQRYSGSAVQDFRAACVAWVLKQYEVGCQELEGLSLDGLDDLDDTRAFRAELQSYVARTGSLPPAVGAGRSAEEKRLHAGLVHVRKRRFAAVRRDRAGRIIDYAAVLQETQLVAWEAVPEFGPFLWNPRHAAVFNAVQQCLLDTGELPARGPKSPTDALAQQVRRIRQKTLLPGNQRMRSAEQQYWEKTFPANLVHPADERLLHSGWAVAKCR